MKRMSKGFTLVEILIVVIILGILAAIVIPQFTQASTQARLSNLQTNLQTVRSQMLLYKTQHNEAYPTDADDAVGAVLGHCGRRGDRAGRDAHVRPVPAGGSDQPDLQLRRDPRGERRRDGLLGPDGRCRLVLQQHDAASSGPT